MRVSIAGVTATTLLAIALSGGGAQARVPAERAECATGPVRVGDTVRGTPCDDVIVAPASVERVLGGAGDDTIVPGPIGAAGPCDAGCVDLGIGSQTFEGGPGDDTVFGERGNDKLYGGAGNDRLFGGIGDDTLRGGPGEDRLSGGFGFDSLDGEGGDDLVRGDATIDALVADSGGDAGDTLSYATGITPGFPNANNRFGPYPDFGAFEGFPAPAGERGAYVDLGRGVADNGLAPAGGGVEAIAGGDFETVIGTPFSDFIVGSGSAETIYGGGGADVILGGGGGDELFGGADGDHCEGPGAEAHCESSGGGGGVTPRDATKVSAGLEAPEEPGPAALYVVGGSSADSIAATYSDGTPAAVDVDLAAGAFDQSAGADGGCDAPSETHIHCPLPGGPPDAIVLAGMGGADAIETSGFPPTTSVVVLGGEGGDGLSGGETSEDVIVDGPGDDESSGLGRDDAVLNNEGDDAVSGDGGNDLLLSNSICEGDEIDGGAARDNASWSKLKEPVEVLLALDEAGRPGGGAPACGGGTLDSLPAIEDLEGTAQDDVFRGDSGENQLLGRNGADAYFGEAGADRILANDGVFDASIDCGADPDVAFVDLPPPKGPGDPTPVECETVYQGPPGDFEVPPTATASALPPVAIDRRPPRTRILHRPRRRVATARARRRVVFVFTADEPARFRCRLDRRRYRRCRSPRAYRLRRGRHVVRIFAVDRAGNRDRTPARFAFRVLRASAHWNRSHHRRARSR